MVKIAIFNNFVKRWWCIF